MPTREDSITKKDLENFKEETIHQFHVVSKGLVDQIKLLAEGHAGIIQRFDGMETRLDGVETKLDRMEKENERQHLETRALVKISFSELDRRLSNLESQIREIQEWRKQVEARLSI